jgi:hypothetical protein
VSRRIKSRGIDYDTLAVMPRVGGRATQVLIIVAFLSKLVSGVEQNQVVPFRVFEQLSRVNFSKMFNPLTPNDLQRRRAVSHSKIKILGRKISAGSVAWRDLIRELDG